MSYLDFYRLQMEPFSNAPNERFYYNSAQHARALTRMMYVAESMKGLAVVVGDIGTGKTTLARKMLDSLPEEAYEPALLVILHSEISSEWLLRKIASQLGIEHPADQKIQIIGQLYRRLLQLHEAGKKAVVLIDEAQMLNTRELMEEFRGLLNLEVTAHKLITFIFFGLPEIEGNLALDPPLQQRVAMKIRLSTLTSEATRAYITHRLAVAGIRDPLFTDDAVLAVHECSGGFPRKINTLCDNVLFQGFLMRKKAIDRAMVEEVAADLGFRPPTPEDRSIPSMDLPTEWVPEAPLPQGPPPFPGASGSAQASPFAKPTGDKSPNKPGGRPGGAPPPDPLSSPGDDIDSRFEEFFKETFKDK